MIWENDVQTQLARHQRVLTVNLISFCFISQSGSSWTSRCRNKQHIQM